MARERDGRDAGHRGRAGPAAPVASLEERLKEREGAAAELEAQATGLLARVTAGEEQRAGLQRRVQQAARPGDFKWDFSLGKGFKANPIRLRNK